MESELLRYMRGLWIQDSDTMLVIRCMYCVARNEFLPMLAYKDGRSVCFRCAHTVKPGDSPYHCTCRNCLSVPFS